MIVFDTNNWLIDRVVVGELMVNCYLVVRKPSNEAVIIDPGDEPHRIIQRLKELEATPTAIVLTHGHGDHIGGNKDVQSHFDLPIAVGASDAEMLPDAWKNLSAPFGMDTTSPSATRLLSEGETVQVGDGILRVLETPGHSAGSVTLAGDGFALVGDLIFQGSVGRTDFPGGSFKLLLEMIRTKVFPLGDDCLLLPGHGEFTTVGEEKRSNPFLQPGFRF